VVSKLQKTVGANTAGASHPELEEELQQEIAKIEPKVATAGAFIGDSLVEPRALAYTSRIAYVSHA